MLRAVLAPVFLCLLLLPARAQTQEEFDRLYEALGLPDVIAIMRQEGLDYGHELAMELFGGPGSARWNELVSEIYEVPRLEKVIRAALRDELEGDDLDPMLAFFESDLGARIIGLELSARTAMLAPDVDAMAREALAEMIEDGAPRLDLLEAFSDTNDLVEFNVMGALNSNYAFYVGLNEGGAFGEDLSEEAILGDVWSQEDEIRAETEDWLMSYLALAYQPLTDAEVAEYVAFSETRAGTALNRAIFEAFDEMYISVSRALGTAAASLMGGQDL